MAEKKGGKSDLEGIDIDLVGHNRRKVDQVESELTRQLFATGPDDGDGLGTHSVNPSKFTPPPPPPPEKK